MSIELTDEMIDAACKVVPDLYRVDAMRAIEAALEAHVLTRLDDERTAFERWATDEMKHPRAAERTETGDYKLMPVYLSWIAWRARADLVLDA